MDISEILSAAGSDAKVIKTTEVDGSRNIYELSVPKAVALEQWRKLSEVSKQTGYSPVFLLGDGMDLSVAAIAVKQQRWSNDIESTMVQAQMFGAMLADPTKFIEGVKMRPGAPPAAVEHAKEVLQETYNLIRFAKIGETCTDTIVAAAAAFGLDVWIDKTISG